MQHSCEVSDGGVELQAHCRFVDHFGGIQSMHRNAQYAMRRPIGHHLDQALCFAHGSGSRHQRHRDSSTFAGVALYIRFFVGQADNANLGIGEDRPRNDAMVYLARCAIKGIAGAMPPSCAPTGVAIWLSVKPPITSPAA